MNEVINFYHQQASLDSAPSWLKQLKSEALSEFEQKGFPNRFDEEWKYTRIDGLLKNSFLKDYSALQAAVKMDLPIHHSLVINNGCVVGYEQLVKNLPAGVVVQPLVVALRERPQLLEQYLGSVLKSEHGFHFLNTAMLECGVFIYLPKKVIINEPLALIHAQGQNNNAVYLRHLIVAEEGSSATIIEDYQGLENTRYLTSSITEIVLGAHSNLTHFKIQRESKLAYHIAHVAVKQAQSSTFLNHSLSLGGLLARSDLAIFLNEEHAHCLMNGIYAPHEAQLMDHHTTVFHQAPNCSSEQDYKGILNGASQAIFNGKVIVAQDAQHTCAKQQNKNILLSSKAEVNTKPQLEIFADDVSCSHGATVGQLDEEALFFLATRGIDRQSAIHYLIHAFTQNNLNLIAESKLADFIEQLLTQ